SNRIVVLPDGQKRTGPSYVVLDPALVAEAGLVDGAWVDDAQRAIILPSDAVHVDSPVATRVYSPTTVSKSAIPASVGHARKIADLVHAIGWALLILSVGVGIAIAAKSERDNYETVHPYVVEGIAIAVGGAFQSLLIIMIASYIVARLDLAQRDA
ncbi:MAG: hypothetical protein RLZ04_2503, partial [Actinomycetota bacterium]